MIMAVAGVAGFFVASRFIPQDLFFGKWNDALFGVAVIAVGYFIGNPYVLAFGVGALVEGLMVGFGIVGVA